MKETIDRLNEWLDQLDEEAKDDISRSMDGFDFSLFMQKLLVSKDTIIIESGNWENANYACACNLLERIKKHPLIWKLFFRI